jgi:hypothetical protein
MNKKETYQIMRFTTWLKESVKTLHLNDILDKISAKKKISKEEQDFLDHYKDTKDEDVMDFQYLSTDSTFFRLLKLIENSKKVICNLYDRDGLIGIQIVGVYQNDDESIFLKLKNTKKDFKLKDNFLYNITYNLKKNEYSLESQDEYFEKVPIKKD